ncbi:NAD(P)-binding protein [Aspergillus stella-maris]|uniref:NAD(P)-binding protein n=1 Tax=Aspergillus stella-maris TaxID=1810926 RepID=UPI003CCD450B
MTPYAKAQPTGFKNAIERVAIVGAGGTIGKHMTASLLASSRFKVTALSRTGSTNTLPQGVEVAHVNYADETTLITALQTHAVQMLIITLSPTAPRQTHSMLINAASKAGVQFIIPNSYGPDIADEKFGRDTLLGPVAKAQRDEIEKLGMKWISVCCGFWYEYSLAGGSARFGFDFEKRRMTFYDQGDVGISMSSMDLVGEGVAKVLSLPISPVDGDVEEEVTLASFFNKPLYIQSFCLSQRDIFESVKRVTNTSDSDWKIYYEDSKTRYADGLAMVNGGNMAGFSKLLYARAFWAGESADLSGKVQNALLGLDVEEDLDEATRLGVEMVEELGMRKERMAH